MIISNNIPAINANRVLNARQGNVSNSFSKLSSGDSIGGSKGNSLSFSVSERMRGQIGGIEAAYRNTVDAISMVETADGFLTEISSLISNFRQLAVQSANSIYSDGERALSQNTAQEIVAEINRVASYATFNGQKLFDGRFARAAENSTPIASLWFQVGENTDRNANAVRVFINTFNASALSLEDLSLSSPQKALDSIEKTENALQVLSRSRAELGSYQTRLESIARTNQVALENFKAAESAIRDTDVASEITELTKNLVLNQVNIAMIAQANAQMQSVIRLLG